MGENKLKKLLIVTHGFPPSERGDTELYSYNLAKSLSDKGLEISVFTRLTMPLLGKDICSGGYVFEDFEALTEKRKVVQERRKRDDKDIFRLFGDPFRNITGYNEYLWEDVALFGHFNLHELFKCSDDYEKRLNEGIYHAKKTLRELTERIRGKTIKTALTIKPDRDIRSLAGKFYMNLKQNGLGTTLRKTGNYLLRLIK